MWWRKEQDISRAVKREDPGTDLRLLQQMDQQYFPQTQISYIPEAQNCIYNSNQSINQNPF